jgi:hypothetical protein
MTINDVIFISYAREDGEAARRIYGDLRKLGLHPWLDQESLLPGERWRPALERAIEDSRYFIALMSSSSVGRRGYVHKELADALEILDQVPESQTFVIPVRLDDCTPPNRRLRDLNWVDMFPSWITGFEKLLTGLIGDRTAAARKVKELISWQPSPKDREVVSALITFLEDRRVLFSQIWGMVGLDSTGSIESIQEIRRRLGDDLEILQRGSGLAESLRRMQDACRDLLDKYDILSKGRTVLISGDTHELVYSFRSVFRTELVRLAEVYDIQMYRLIPSADALARGGLNASNEEQFLFASDDLWNIYLRPDR